MVMLIAEDDPLISMTLETFFTKEGYKVISTNNGREAMLKIEEHLPDIILTDVMMPFYSGLEIIAKIKSGFNKKIIVVVLSAMGQESAVKEAFELGADDYVTKPFSLAELSLRVKRLVKVRGRNTVLQLDEKF
ncbi:response regulator [Segetibacter sp.]|uniref:response regulator transcription factor n=1 Tax=Segetibacter sp. TaxID=2231182 RepID=UPI00262CCCCA|nr:response regulator [Segetibacter sp.]